MEDFQRAKSTVRMADERYLEGETLTQVLAYGILSSSSFATINRFNANSRVLMTH